MVVFYPLFLRLEGKRVVVVGDGDMAARKARELREAGADVVVQATYDPGALQDAWLVVSATADEASRERVAADAQARRLFLLAVDDVERASAISPGVVRRGPVAIAISSGGEAPALVRLLREIVEQLLPEERYVEIARELRKRWKAEKRPMGSRFSELVAAFKGQS